MLWQLRRATLAALSIANEGVLPETRSVRAGILSAVCILAFVAPASAQEWAKKLFTVTAHDFGTVANGAKTEFRFPIKNVFVEDLHIEKIRSSCGCTTPTLVMKGESKAQEPGGGLTLKTYEQGEVLAQFNTHIMTGYKRATLTLTIDKPYHAEVQLTVQGNIITDIQVTPNHIDLSNVSQGEAVEKTITLTHWPPRLEDHGHSLCEHEL